MRSKINYFKLFSYINRDTKGRTAADVILVIFIEHHLQNTQERQRMKKFQKFISTFFKETNKIKPKSI